MTGKTHLGIGSVVYVSICNKLPGKFTFIGMIVVIIASLLPDIDHPKSIINKYILPFKNNMTKVMVYICLGIIILWVDNTYTKEPAVKALGICLIAIGFSSHREGLTHSLTGMIIFTFIIDYIEKKYGFKYLVHYFMIGYGTHLVCDMATKRGIPLFYPFSKRKYKFPFTYKVGSKVGKAIEEALMIAGLAYVVYRLPLIL